MRKLTLVLSLIVLLGSCNILDTKRVKGSGVVVTEERTGLVANRIKLAGFMDVELTQGNDHKVVVEADDNLLKYIRTYMNEDGVLVIKVEDNIKFANIGDLKVYITTNRLDQITLTGSGDIVGMNKFTGSDKVKLKISGIGDIKLALNAPEVEADISGSGSMYLSGETREAKFSINGIGDCDAAALKAEHASVKIAGNGDARVYADATLDVKIKGIGSVYYKGGATVNQQIAGNGSVKKLTE